MSQTTLRAAVAAVALVPLLGYALGTWAAGGPSFPGDRGECARVAAADGQGPLELVAGHFSSVAEAETVAARLAGGSRSFRVAPDGCGRWKVTTVVGSFEEGRQGIAELARVDVVGRLEVDPAPAV